VLAVSKAVLMVICLLIGLEMAGLFGALLGQGAAMVAAYPVVVWLSRSTGAWDAGHDAALALAGAGVTALAFWFNWAAIADLAARAAG